MGGEFTYQPKWDPKTVLSHSHMEAASTPLDLGPWGSGKSYPTNYHEPDEPDGETSWKT